MRYKRARLPSGQTHLTLIQRISFLYYSVSVSLMLWNVSEESQLLLSLHQTFFLFSWSGLCERLWSYRFTSDWFKTLTLETPSVQYSSAHAFSLKPSSAFNNHTKQ